MKNNINIDNCEAYFLDYHEGRLSPALVQELMDFVEKHPGLKEEFESFEPITLNEGNHIKYEAKDKLKKKVTAVNSTNFEEYAIESLEGIISPVWQNELNSFISQNPRYQKEFDLYAKTKLLPDSEIIFDDKVSLKRGMRRPAAWFYWSAAASVALIIGAYFMLNKNKIPDGNSIVNQNQVIDSNRLGKNIANVVIPDSGAPKINPSVLTPQPVVITPVNSNNNMLQIAVKRKANNLQMLTAININSIPTGSKTRNFVLRQNLPDTNGIPDTNIGKVWTTVESIPARKRNKLFIFLATITCKGLHQITGQHIELEKKFDTDTTNIIAYQLDLGNKKYEFPVKD